MIVRWTTPAANDLERIARYIRKDNAEAAIEVAKALFDAADSLNRFPRRGRVGVIDGTRELVFPGWPYILVYEVTDNAVNILHIRHGSRKSP